MFLKAAFTDMRYKIFRKEYGLKKFTSQEIFLLDMTYGRHPIQNERFWGCSRILVGGAGGKRFLPHKIFHTYCAIMKLGTVIPYLKKIQKIYKSRDTPLDFC